MKKTEKRIKIILDELKKERVVKTPQKKKKDFCVINLTFPIRNFYKKNGHAEFIKGVQIGAFNTWNASWDKASFPYEKNITYTMTTNGLIPINQVK